jgi:hypothetical protein
VLALQFLYSLLAHFLPKLSAPPGVYMKREAAVCLRNARGIEYASSLESCGCFSCANWERLGISPEQALKIRTQTSDFHKAQICNRAELQVKHIELNDLLSADKPDRGCD